MKLAFILLSIAVIIGAFQIRELRENQLKQNEVIENILNRQEMILTNQKMFMKRELKRKTDIVDSLERKVNSLQTQLNVAK